MRHTTHLLSILLVGALSSASYGQSFDLTASSFHAATEMTSGGPQNETGSADNGGLWTLQMVNNSGGPIQLSDLSITLNGTSIGSVGNLFWHRLLPANVPAGAPFALQIKTRDVPFNEGASVAVVVNQGANELLNQNITLQTPALRLGSVITNPITGDLEISFKNRSSTDDLTIASISVNGETIPLSSLVGGASIPAGALNFSLSSPAITLDPLTPLHVSATFTLGVDPTVRTTAATLRLPIHRTPVATWSGSIFTDEARLTSARADLGLNSSVSTFNLRRTFEGHQRYGQQVIPSGIVDNDGTGTDRIVSGRFGEHVLSWNLWDEPDLGAKSVGQISTINRLYWQEETGIPTSVTLAAHRSFQRYGTIPDTPLMDHYAHYAPLVYNTGFLSSTYPIVNTWRYSNALRENTEPLLNWTWVQGISPATSSWNGQPDSWSLDIQLWNHVLGGAKGFLWFKAEPEELAGFPAQRDRIAELNRALNLVRGMIYRSDILPSSITVAPSGLPTGGGVNTVTAEYLKGTIAAPGAALFIATNATSQYTRNSIGADNVTFTPVTIPDLCFTKPSWLTSFDAYRVTESGLTALAPNVSGDNVCFGSVTLNMASPTFVVLLTATGTPTAPTNPEKLRIARWVNDQEVVLAWEESLDQFGIKAYEILDQNDNIIKTTTTTVTNLVIPSGVDEIRVRAVNSFDVTSSPSNQLGLTPFRWLFDVSGYQNGWVPNDDSFALNFEGDALIVPMLASNRQVEQNGLNIDASVYTQLRLVVKNETAGNRIRFFWNNLGTTAYNNDRLFAVVTTPNNSDFVTIDVDLSGQANWTGTINGIRLLPSPGETTGRLLFREISLRPVFSSVDDWMMY